eukprot:7056437-Lingulodinium_polyedra.AAC.1
MADDGSRRDHGRLPGVAAAHLHIPVCLLQDCRVGGPLPDATPAIDKRSSPAISPSIDRPRSTITWSGRR